MIWPWIGIGCVAAYWAGWFVYGLGRAAGDDQARRAQWEQNGQAYENARRDRNRELIEPTSN